MGTLQKETMGKHVDAHYCLDELEGFVLENSNGGHWIEYINQLRTELNRLTTDLTHSRAKAKRRKIARDQLEDRVETLGDKLEEATDVACELKEHIQEALASLNHVL